MTTNPDTRLMPAAPPTHPTPTSGSDRREVKDVTIFESRRARGKRAWDELSEIDRAVILESVRQRRKAREQRHAVHHELFGLRANR